MSGYDDDDDIEFPPPVIRTRRMIDYAKYEAAQTEITALRAAHEALLRRTQSLETALDQERADNERLRAVINEHLVAIKERMYRDEQVALDALLSGRQEGDDHG